MCDELLLGQAENQRVKRLGGPGKRWLQLRRGGSTRDDSEAEMDAACVLGAVPWGMFTLVPVQGSVTHPTATHGITPEV